MDLGGTALKPTGGLSGEEFAPGLRNAQRSAGRRRNVRMRLYRLFLGIPALLGAAGPHYRDVAAEWGIAETVTFGNPAANDFILETTGTGAAIFDFDGDGDNDVFVVNGTTFALEAAGESPLAHLYENDGAGRFREIGAQAGLTKTGWGQGVCAGDYDNDGATDLFVTYFGSNVLYRNLGGKFEDATGKAKLPAAGRRWGAGCAFLDYDRDGNLDIFVANYVDLDLENTPKPGSGEECRWKGLPVMCGPRGLPRAFNALYRNRGDGAFEDVSEQAGILAPGGRYGLGVVSADFNNDGLTDIYVGCDMTAGLLYQNNGDGTFSETGGETGVAYNVNGQLQAGMGVAVADYDGNGFLDIVKTNFSGDLPSLYNNEDGFFFEDVSMGAGLGVNQLLGWGVVFVDADEDSRPDILMAHGHVYPEVDAASIGETYRQPMLFYRNAGGGRFTDDTAGAGEALAQKRPSRGMAAGDLDGDGHPEIVVVNLNAPPTLLRNTAELANAAAVELIGGKSNRSAIGARALARFSGKTVIREVSGGGSYFSQNDLTLYFGLGGAERIERLEVAWPSGRKQSWTDLAANRRHTLTEGKRKAASTPLRRRPVP